MCVYVGCEVCVGGVHHDTHVEVRRVILSFLLYVVPGTELSLSGLEVRQQVPVPAEPSCWPLFHLFKNKKEDPRRVSELEAEPSLDSGSFRHPEIPTHCPGSQGEDSPYLRPLKSPLSGDIPGLGFLEQGMAPR